MSARACRSQHRCNQITCETCCWRYCRHVTARILTRSTSPLHTITLTIPNPSPQGFRSWRVEVRNRVDHLRRMDRRWRELGLHVWGQRDGAVRGIVSLGVLGPDDVVKGLERWNATLGPEVAPEGLRVAIWGVVKPSAIYAAGPAQGRYWPVRCSIWPCRAQWQGRKAQDLMLDQIDPMPLAM